MRNNEFVLSADPGENTGLALWSMAGALYCKEVVREDGLDRFIDNIMSYPEQWKIKVIVYEDFLLYQHKAQQQTGSRFVTSQVIGKLKMLGKLQGAKMVRQPANILRVAAAHTGTKIPKVGHIKDDISAYLHGYYYFETAGILKPVLQMQTASR